MHVKWCMSWDGKKQQRKKNREGADPSDKGCIVKESFVLLLCTVATGGEDSRRGDKALAYSAVNLSSFCYHHLGY